MNAVVVIPAHNEEKHLQDTIKKVKKHQIEVIVVDDGSRDQTKNIAKKEGVIVLSHSVNLGKGAALKTGCDYAIRQGFQQIVVLDGDGQHDPEKIPEFLANLKKYDLVFGYRELSQNMPVILRFGNWFINKTTKLLYKINLNDTQCGYRAFTAETYKKIRWQAADYCMESEMIANAGKYQLKYTQIPIQTIYADKYKGTTVADGIKIVLRMISWRILK